MLRRTLLIRVGLLTALLPATAALAAETVSPGDTLAEVVVSAQKRTETVQSVPVAITVISDQELARQGVSTIVDLSRASASLEFTAPAASPGGGAFIRGIGTESVGGLTAQPSVGIVLDGVVLGNANVTSIFDLERVEVLKGPQGTLFGNSVSAGVISLVTAAPDPSKSSGYVNVEWGSGDLGSEYSRSVVRAVANLPLSDSSALRIAAHADHNANVFDNVTLGLRSDQSDNGARVRYLWKAGDDLTVNLIGEYNRYSETGVPVLTYRAAPPGPGLGQALADCGVTPGDANFTSCGEVTNVRQQTDRGLSAQIDWAVGGNTLTSITAFRKGDTASRGDIQAIPLAIASKDLALFNPCSFFNCVPIFQILPGGTNELQTQNRTQFSEELRLASPQNKHLEWVAGLFYLHYKLDDFEPGLFTAQFPGPPPCGFVQCTSDTTFEAGVHTEDYAGFVNLTYFFTDATRLIAGGRYTHSKVDEWKHDPSNSHDDLTYSASGTASKFTYRLGLQHDFASHVMSYATVSSGYKGPQISDALQLPQKMYVVGPELPTSYEIGVKASAFDNRLAIDADVFYTDVKDYQGQYCFANAQGTITCDPQNISSVKSKGAEVEIFGKPVAGLSLDLSGIYNPATYPHYLDSNGNDLDGTQLTHSSKWKFTFSAEYTAPLSANYGLVIGADAAYRSKQLLYPAVGEEFFSQSGTTYNARLGLASSKDWSIFLFGRNLGAQRFPRQIYPTPFAAGGLWQVLDANAKRLVGLQLDAKF